jgi:hypothetical protein
VYWRLQQDQRCRTLATVGLILVRHNRWRAEYCRGPHPPTVFGYHVTWSTGTMFLFGIVVGAVALLEPIVLVAGTPSLARRRHDARTAPAPSDGQSWSSTGASTPLAAPKLEHHCVPINNVKNEFTAAKLLHRHSIPDGGLQWSKFPLYRQLLARGRCPKLTRESAGGLRRR